MKVKVISLPCIFQVLYVLCFTRPGYQVSVYRTIGSLVIGIFIIVTHGHQNFKVKSYFYIKRSKYRELARHGWHWLLYLKHFKNRQ